MNETRRSIRLRRLQTDLGQIVYELTRIQITEFAPPEVWAPALNAYQYDHCIAVCMDLAGVARDKIKIRVEPRRLLIEGRRNPPEPEGMQGRPTQILAMEIDHGPFRRELTLARDVDSERVSAEHRDGLLWIFLPYRSHA